MNLACCIDGNYGSTQFKIKGAVSSILRQFQLMAALCDSSDIVVWQLTEHSAFDFLFILGLLILFAVRCLGGPVFWSGFLGCGTNRRLLQQGAAADAE